MSDSDRNWQAWGEQDPYYAVLSDPRYRRGSIDDARQDFFADGRDYLNDLLGRFERHFGSVPRERALDFGCGVGRLTIPLAGHFGSVTGLDIAPAMLEEARRNSADLPIDYRLSDDALSALEGQYDFILSCIVLQHIPVRRGMPLLDALLSRISPGGGCAIHVSIKRRQDWRGRLRYALVHQVPGGQALSNLLRGRPAAAPVMQMNEYPLPDVLRLFQARGFHDLLVRYDDHGGFDTALIMGVRG
ncbi:class I SAM-dependent methyltransferase [Sphingobium sufflavum]|uniref:class I SAM-dependent methyltransferase n=1 Tax=Sphingobium sufflavum TaxID=1129547 RepID=UPI001F3D52B2|nr:class I SAM-dependent methyltransferase [Sphingobium sufflavum]MCE7798229.1 class I SAM-dependent methyltransferase [Sphingobium sufflavum]